MRAADYVVLSIVLVLAAAWIGGLVDVARRDPEAFAHTGRSRTLWLVAIGIGGIAGTFVYVCFVRRSVRRAEAAILRDGPASAGAGATWDEFAPRPVR